MFSTVKHAGSPAIGRAGCGCRDGAHLILEKCLTEDLEVFELGDLQMIRVDGHDVERTHAMLDNVNVCLTWVART